jgi:large subunit ribosomal protein L7Ae
MPKRAVKSRRRAQTKNAEPKTESAFKPRPKNFSTGCAIKPKTYKLGRMIKWPKYIRIQRQEQVLKRRLKVPAAIAQFTRAADKGLARECFKLFRKYQPPTKVERKERLKKIAEARAAGNEAQIEHEPRIKFGLNHVTNLIQRKKAEVVLIAHDVEPLELVVWLPTLCYKSGVPFVIIKGKSALGELVRMKTATCCCLTSVRNSDNNELANLKEKAMKTFNETFEESRSKPRYAEMGTKCMAKRVKRGE